MRTAETIEQSKSSSLTTASPSEKPKRKIHPNSLANLKPYPKGVSGCPGGKHKYDVAAELARAVIEEYKVEAFHGLAAQLIKGNAYTFKELAERAYGKLKETKEVTHLHGDVPDADLNKRIAELERELGLAAAIDEAGRTGIAAAGSQPANSDSKNTELLPG